MRKYGLPYQDTPIRRHRDLEDTDSERREWALQIAYNKRVEHIIREADKDTDTNYKGITVRAINEAMGEDVDRERTAYALDWLELRKSETTPTRFTFRMPEVQYVMREKWGKPATVIKAYQFDARSFPERSIYGKKDK